MRNNLERIEKARPLEKIEQRTDREAAEQLRAWFDESLYPDIPSPKLPASEGERIDFIARLCGAWDFGILPRKESIDEVRAYIREDPQLQHI